MSEKGGFRPPPPKKVRVKAHTRTAPRPSAPSPAAQRQGNTPASRRARPRILAQQQRPKPNVFNRPAHGVANVGTGRKPRPKPKPVKQRVRPAPYKLLSGPGSPNLTRPQLKLANRSTDTFRREMKKAGLITTAPAYPGQPRELWPKGSPKMGQVSYGRPRSKYVGNEAKLIAPSLKILNQTTRPVHAIAGGIDAALKGKSVSRAVVRGAELKDNKLFSDVLKTAGVPRGIRGPAGFALDVAADPTTYATLGVGSVARKGILKAGEQAAAKHLAEAGPKVLPATKGVVIKAEKQATRRAIKQGKPLGEAKALGAVRAREVQATQGQRKLLVGATRKGRRAAQRAAQNAPEDRGLQVGFEAFGKSLKTSGKTTAKLAAPLRKEPGALRTNVKDVGSTFSPHVKPADLSAGEFQGLKTAERQARAGVARGRFRAVQRARAMQAIPKEHHAQVIDAIERGTTYNLPENLKAPAQAIEKEFKQARKAELKAGIPTPQSRTGYFSHQLEQAAMDAAKKKGGSTLRPGFTKERRYKGTVQRIKEQGGPEFSTKVPEVLGSRLAVSAQAVSKARLGTAIAKAGRKVTPGKLDLGPGEAVFEIAKGSSPRALERAKAEDRALLDHVLSGRVPKGKQYVVLNRQAVERATQNTAAHGRAEAIKRGYDKVTGGFKLAATYPNPGFHARNLVGDTFNAHLGEAPSSLSRAVPSSARALKRLGGKEERMLKTEAKRQGPPPKVTIKDHYGIKRDVSLDKLTREAEQQGVIRTGFFGREIPELTKSSETKVGRVSKAAGRLGPAKRAGRGVKRTLQSREDLMRLALYIAGRKRGLTAEGAAAHSTKQLFDYGDLSPLERNTMRRIMPFYTWTSRNIPLQARTLVSRPGKYANLEKAREEAGKASGQKDLPDWEKKLPEYQQRAMPFPVKGGKVALSFGAGGIPASDLNQLSLKPDEQAQKVMSLLNPLIRTPLELKMNYSNFFRSQIERDDSPLVRAPGYVANFPPAVRKKLGIVNDFVDKRTGKKTWGWPGKVDYIAKQPPGPFNFAQQISTEGANRRGQGQGGKALSYLTGLKVDPVERASRISALYDERKKLIKRRGALGQRGQGSGKFVGKRGTKEYHRVAAKLKAVEQEITKLSKERGDKQPLLARPKGKGSGGGSSLLGGQRRTGSILDGTKKSTSILDH